MGVKEIRNARKRRVTWTDWKSGKVPQSSFPLSMVKKKRYSLGASYRWRICKFQIGGQRYRIWVAMRPDLEKFFAHLGEERAGDMVVLASLEFHGGHAGWHYHAACGKENRLMPGRLRDKQLMDRVPRADRFHRRTKFGVTEKNAADVVSRAFGLYNTEDDNELGL